MSVRDLPVRPDLEQLKRQAKELLAAIREGQPEALAELAEHHPDPIDPSAAKLADAQLVLARSYRASSWPRLVQACELIDAIWRDDAEAVRELVTRNGRPCTSTARSVCDPSTSPRPRPSSCSRATRSFSTPTAWWNDGTRAWTSASTACGGW